MRKIITAALTMALAFMGHANAEAATNVQCIAHRGYSAAENTVNAVKEAADAGADVVETDVFFTKTGFPVIMHDSTVDRTTNGTGKISSKTVTQFTKLKTSDGQHPPTLYQMMHAMDVNGVRGLIELKTNPTSTQWRNFLSKVPAGMKGKFQVQSFDAGAVYRAMRSGLPGIRLLKRAYTGSWVWKYDGVAVEYHKVGRSYANLVRSHGLKIYAWTADDASAIDRLAWDPVDGVISNKTPRCVSSPNR